ncbi:hypothetical protein [Enterovibrio sp. 27052020O]|uniref:hypothetical protein n=1 Tax=Enterovibrio sp. 27052020O TaxID=3241166 RepID=UPI003890F352
MDMEHLVFSHTNTTPALVPWGQVSTELTGFTGVSHYHLQRMLGDDGRKSVPPSHEEWPSSLLSEPS